MSKVYLVDDDPLICKNLKVLLEKRDFEVGASSNALEACSTAEEFQPDVIVLDLAMPERNGMELLSDLHQKIPEAKVIFYTGTGVINDAVQAMKCGAFDFIQKPLNYDALLLSVEKALEFKRIYTENQYLREKQKEDLGLNLIGIFSEKSRNVFDLARKYAQNRHVPVLIVGESGTGKEVVARFIHTNGEDFSKPLVALNCGAIPKELVESELFGYDKGAFTGAKAGGQKGKFELASGGTLFLDEIGELPLDIQVKLLRVLEDGRFYKVGAEKETQVKTRIICATNKDLAKAIEENKFRKDLFYRINVGKIVLPTLRERKSEIVPLALHFMKQFNTNFNKDFQEIAPAARKILENHQWEGNIRELRNTIERIVLMEEGPDILPNHLAFLGQGDISSLALSSFDQHNFTLPEEHFDIEDFTLELVHKAFEKYDQNLSKTARYLGISRDAVRYRIKQYRTQHTD
jgi:DNA-binding NtrC family response regulator